MLRAGTYGRHIEKAPPVSGWTGRPRPPPTRAASTRHNGRVDDVARWLDQLPAELAAQVHRVGDEALAAKTDEPRLANQPDGSQTPVRAGRRMRYIDEALRPLGERLGEPARKRLRSALALTLGTHAVLAMKDSAGLDDDEEIVATLEWAAGALLRAALHDVEPSE